MRLEFHLTVAVRKCAIFADSRAPLEWLRYGWRLRRDVTLDQEGVL